VLTDIEIIIITLIHNRMQRLKLNVFLRGALGFRSFTRLNHLITGYM
jgi:hypothetical protein